MRSPAVFFCLALGAVALYALVDRFARWVDHFRVRIYVSGKQETVGWYDTEKAARLAMKELHVALAETSADYEGTSVAKFAHKVLTRREVKGKVRDPDTDWSRFHDSRGGSTMTRAAGVDPTVIAEALSRGFCQCGWQLPSLIGVRNNSTVPIEVTITCPRCGLEFTQSEGIEVRDAKAPRPEAS